MVGRGVGFQTRSAPVSEGCGSRENTHLPLGRGSRKTSSGIGRQLDTQAFRGNSCLNNPQIGRTNVSRPTIEPMNHPLHVGDHMDDIGEEDYLDDILQDEPEVDGAGSATHTPVDDPLNQPSPMETITTSGRNKHSGQLYKRAELVLNMHEAADPTPRQDTRNTAQLGRVRTKCMHGSRLCENEQIGAEAQNGSSEASATSAKRKRGERGKYRSLVVEKKTMNGKTKLEVEIPDFVLQAVGVNARTLVNYCGYVVRTIPVMDCSDWALVGAKFGDSMWIQVKDKFKVKSQHDAPRLQAFIIYLMQRLYRYWKARLHKYYQECGGSLEECLSKPPEDFPPDQWKLCCQHFESEAFKKKSKRGSTNRRSDKWCKHTTGNLSFPEVEAILTEKNNNVKPTADVIWLAEHTRTNDKGVLEWVSDKRSKEVHSKLHELVINKDQDGAPQSQEEMLLTTLGAKSGYTRGKGAGYGGASLKARIQMEQQQKLLEQQEMISTLVSILEANKNEMDAYKAQREKDMEELRTQQQRELSDLEKRLTCLIATHTI